MNRKFCGAALAVAMALVCGPALASDKADVRAAIRHLIADSNSGDDEAFKADLTEPALFIDEYAPFHWRSAKESWLNAFNAYNKDNAVTDARTTIQAFRHVNVGNSRAYVVLKSLYTYKQHGKPMKEPGAEVFTLTKASGRWLVDGYAWFSKDTVDTSADGVAVLAEVRSVIDQFNAGKASPATLGWTGIIDEFPTFNWQGTDAVNGWFADFERDAAKSGSTGTRIALGKPEHLSADGANAYLALPATLTSKHRGKPSWEKGRFVFVLVKTTGAWHIANMAWATD
jgi:ketosteroid isomerase-like protein